MLHSTDPPALSLFIALPCPHAGINLCYIILQKLVCVFPYRATISVLWTVQTVMPQTQFLVPEGLIVLMRISRKLILGSAIYDAKVS